MTMFPALLAFAGIRYPQSGRLAQFLIAVVTGLASVLLLVTAAEEIWPARDSRLWFLFAATFVAQGWPKAAVAPRATVT
jgi:hypothetical protein